MASESGRAKLPIMLHNVASFATTDPTDTPVPASHPGPRSIYRYQLGSPAVIYPEEYS